MIDAADPAIAILPPGLRLGPSLASVALSELVWPLGCPDRLHGKRIADLGAQDHLVGFPSTAAHFQLRRGTQAKISLILGEPSIIHAKHLMLLRASHRRFHKILTFNETLLGRIPNGIFFPLGSTWVPEWRGLEQNKQAMCSLIASAKADSTGHKLRHKIVDWVRKRNCDVTVMGRGYTPFEAKADGLAPFRYSVVIENVREQNYFSEKLVDAVLCRTVPIYWGCANLERFINTDGIIQCASEADIRQAIERMSQADYDARLPAINARQSEISAYADLELRAAVAIRDSL